MKSLNKENGLDSLDLVAPSVKYEEGYCAALIEQEMEINPNDTLLEIPNEGESFDEFVQRYTDRAKGKNLPKEYVPATMFWIVNNGVFLGRCSIRHTLNEYLEKYGGHIGYWIRPSERRNGYGTYCLKIALDKARSLGLSRTLLTVNDDNIPSIRIIEMNGGILENIVENEEENSRVRRYWIRL